MQVVHNNFFPYPNFKEGQETIYSAILENQSILIHAPTGAGKTIASLSALLECKRPRDKIFVIVGTISQFNPILRECYRIQDMHQDLRILPYIGRNLLCGNDCLPKHMRLKSDTKINWKKKLRKLNTQLKLRPKIQEFLMLVKRGTPCSRMDVDNMMKYANIIVTTYPYLEDKKFSKLLKLTKTHMSQILLLVDEAHNLIERKDYAKLSRDEVHFWSLYYHSDPFVRMICQVEKGIMNGRKAKEIQGYDTSELEKKLQTDLKETSHEGYTIRLENFLHFLQLLKRGFVNYTLLKGFYVFDLYPQAYLAKFANSRKQIYQSATFFNLDGISKLFGLPKTTRKVQLIRMLRSVPNQLRIWVPVSTATLQGLLRVYSHCSSSVPNQLRIWVPVSTSEEKYRNPRNYKNMARAIEKIFAASPRHVLVVCPSYEYMTTLKEYLEHDTLNWSIFETETSSFAELHQPLVSNYIKHLVFANQRGKIREGIEWVEDGNSLVSTVIMAGIATFVPNEDAVVDLWMKELYERVIVSKLTQELIYDYPTAVIARQSFGRAIRSPNDRGAFIILDTRAGDYLSKQLLLTNGRSIDDVVNRMDQLFHGYPDLYDLIGLDAFF